MQPFLQGLKSICTRIVCILEVSALLMIPGTAVRAAAESGDSSHLVDIGIIVTPTLANAQSVLKQLNAGMDFAVLAKERSIDATASDGGYMGKVDPDQLRGELRDALRDRAAGQLTDIVQIPSGFAILKVLSARPTAEDLNPKRILALLATGAIRRGPAISGITEANLALLDYPKPDGWQRDLGKVCELRTDSQVNAKQVLVDQLSASQTTTMGTDEAVATLRQESALAQLYAYSGEMEKSIDAWKAAYKLAESVAPIYLPNLQETLGASYLHLSEMENGIYHDSSDLDIFPPLHPHASFARKEESKQAIEWYLKYLGGKPGDLEVRWQLNLAYMTLGEYPTGVPAAYLIPESDFRSKENIGRFVDVAPTAGLNVFRGAGGVIVDDFDNDGLLDVIVSSVNNCDSLRFFHNNGDGTFSDRTKQAGLSDQLGGINLLQADYNNDGCMDILVLRGGWEFPQRKSLLRNNCNGTFTDVTDASGLGATITASHGAAWADIDNDGYLDLFLANENAPAQLFHNKGDGTFEEIGHVAGIDQTAFSKGVAAADYDRDGFVDFYVSNQNGVNFLYHNNGDKTFTEVGKQAGVQAPAYSFATWFFDYDNDGWPDLFVNTYITSVDESIKTYLGQPHNAETLKLYRNKHDGTFEDVTAKAGLDKVFMTMGANFGDVDNDGFLDVYLGNGQPSLTSPLPHVLLRNKDGKSFVDITESSGTGELHKGHAIAFADLSRNGREDIVAEIGGAVPSDAHAMRVFENPGNNNDWLNVRLIGVKSNRAAIGAEIHVTVQDGDSPPRSIYRTVGETSSFGANPMEQNIGLGLDAHGVTVDVWWPATKTSQHFAGVAKNQHIEIKEFATSYTTLHKTAFRLGKNNAQAAATQQRTVQGMLLGADAAEGTIVVSCEAIPGYMDAMVMPFAVRDTKVLKAMEPGATVRFTLVERGREEYAEHLETVKIENAESEPMEAGNLTALHQALNPAAAARALSIGQPVPDFALIDQANQVTHLAQFKGKVVALTFAYSRCPNPNYCFRLSNNLAQLSRRFHDLAGHDLALITIVIDPDNDQGNALGRYADTWKADPATWHFLTGQLTDIQKIAELFGMNFWSDDGFLTHSFHTVVIDREGRLAANLDGNQFTAQQLGDLVQTVLQRAPASPTAAAGQESTASAQ
jgi:cytochrome oxidase Cu insertion factor (SCO1/SenC/PrrC family)/Cu/Ag efflux protein CusF